jgi:glycosyltransferase involved in cell wall biosynthesis
MIEAVDIPAEAAPAATWSVLMLSRHEPEAASSRLRTFQYLPYLRASGAAVTVVPFFDTAYLRHLYGSGGHRRGPDVLAAYARRLRALTTVRRHSVVWVEKEVFPFLPASFERLLGWLGRPWVVDYDDATFHTYDRHRSAMVRWALGRKLAPLLRDATAVTVGNTYLETQLRGLGARHVVRVPTVVDITRYPRRDRPLRDIAAPLRIGWIGTPATSKYLPMLREPLAAAARHYRIVLVTIGASPLDDFPVPVEPHAWSSESEAALLASLDVGVMPLPDEPWERGKCGYKLIQYMASGLPVVASPVGVNTDIVTPEVGVLARTAAEWANALGTLAGDPEYCRALGVSGRARVEHAYSLQVVAARVVGVLRQAAGLD